MDRSICDKDIERGDFLDDIKIAADEKRSPFDSQQSSPTLTQGSFEDKQNDNGMYWNCQNELNN